MKLKSILIMLSILFIQSHMKTHAADEVNVLRMQVFPYMPLEFTVTGSNIFKCPKIFRINNKMWPDADLAESVSTDLHFSQYPGFSLAFMHPLDAGFDQKNKESKDFIIKDDYLFGIVKDGIFEPQPLKMLGSVKYTRTGWSYNFSLCKEQQKNIFISAKFGTVPIKALTIKVDTRFDMKNMRVKESKIKYGWKLDTPLTVKVVKKIKTREDVAKEKAAAKKKREKEKAAAKKNRIANAKKTSKQRTAEKKSAKARKEAAKRAAIVAEAREKAEAEIAKNFDPGKNDKFAVWKSSIKTTVEFKFNRIIDQAEEDKRQIEIEKAKRAAKEESIKLATDYLLKKVSDDTAWKTEKHKTHLVGELGLAMYALLRAGQDPASPDFEKILLNVIKFSKEQGYKAGAKSPGHSGYVAPCLLMMCEAALNENAGDEVKKVDTTVNVNSEKKVYRGSKELQKALLDLANQCVVILNANINLNEVAAIQKAKEEAEAAEAKSLIEEENYQAAVSKAKAEGKKAPAKKATVKTKAKKIVFEGAPTSTQRGHLWGYTGKRAFSGAPHYSPAQYAVLGLRCAKLIGIPVNDNVWEDCHKGIVKDFHILDKKSVVTLRTGHGSMGLVLIHSKGAFLKLEMKDSILGKFAANKLQTNRAGLWGYRANSGGHSLLNFNMVCAALGNLAMAYSFSPDTAMVNADIQKDMTKQMGAGLLYCQIVLEDLYKDLSLYEYYSWERVAVFYGITKIDGKDWHELMSKKIMDSQDPVTGQVKAGRGDLSSRRPTLATSYALLFLKKATKKLKRYSSGSGK